MKRILAALTVSLFSLVPAAPAATVAQSVLSGSTSPVVLTANSSTLSPTKPTVTRSSLTSSDTGATMEIEVALQMRNFADLQTKVASHVVIPAAEFASNYEPLASDYQSTVNWLTSQGLTITYQDPSHLAVFAQGTVAQIAKAFSVTFAKVAWEGSEFTSAVNAPSVPTALASVLASVNGLQPHVRKHHHTLVITPSSTTSNAPPYLPSQIAAAYNANGVTPTGAGQVIAIVMDNVPSTSDLTSFWTTCGIKQSLSNIQFIPVGGGALPAVDSQGEATLDVEWASSMAPGAKVRLYATTSLSDVALDKAYQQIFNDLPSQPGLHQVSLSYGEAEDITPASQLNTDAQYFAELAGAGVTVVVASGDGGSRPTDNSFSSRSPLSVETPASDPSVTSVGGTTLHLNVSTGAVTTEIGWADSGGGISGHFSRPSWQTGAGVPSGTNRLVPDVAAVGDPNTGGLLILNGHSIQIGGTSLGTPIWAGICALINQALVANNKSVLGLLGPKIYPLLGTSSFRDITSGSNGDYSAGTGYDMVTGLGVPDVSALLQSLANVSTPTPPPSIVTQPSNQQVTAGQSASFTVVATGTGILTYQWQSLASGGTTWTNVTANATSATLTASNTTLTMSGEEFRCVVTNSGGSITSNAAALTINAPPPPPAPVGPKITQQPQSETVTVGRTAQFYVVASGTTPLTYQWSKNNAAITNATSSTLTIADAQTTDTGSYTVVVTNSVTSVTSNVATLTVNAASTPPSPPTPPTSPTPPKPPTPPNPPPARPTITSQPADVLLTSGQTATFAVGATSTNSSTLYYQWLVNDEPIRNATNATLSLANTQVSDDGLYEVVVYNNGGEVWSNPAALTVSLALTGVQQTWANDQLTDFDPVNGVPTGLAPLANWENNSAIAWLDELTIAGNPGLTDAAIQSGIQSNLSTTLTAMFAASSQRNLAEGISYALYVEPWLLGYYNYAKTFYVATNGDIYVQAITVDGSTTTVVSTLRLPAAYLNYYDSPRH